MLKSEEKRTPFMGNRTVRDGSVTMEKLADDVKDALNASPIEFVTQAQFNALTPDSNVLYMITE